MWPAADRRGLGDAGELPALAAGRVTAVELRVRRAWCPGGPLHRQGRFASQATGPQTGRPGRRSLCDPERSRGQAAGRWPARQWSHAAAPVIDLFDAVTNTYKTFSLIAASVKQADYQPSRTSSSDLIPKTQDWHKWDQEIDEFLPKSELVAVETFKSSVGRNRTRYAKQHRLLLVQLNAGLPLDENEWQRVARLTLEDLEKCRRGIREDVLQRDIRPTLRRSLVDLLRRLRRSGQNLTLAEQTRRRPRG